MIDLASVRLAVLVSEHVSFRRAAIALNIRLSILSRRVRALEDALGVSLFERYPGGIRTTIAGRRFIERAELALSDMDYAIRCAGIAGIGEEGRLRIGVFASLAAPYLGGALTAFRGQNPNVEITITEAAPGAHVARIRERRLDLAFILGHGDVPGCDRMILWREKSFLAMPIHHRLADRQSIAWSDLKGEVFVVRRQEPGPTIQDYVIRSLAEMGHSISAVRFDVSRENLMHLVALGFGVALASESTTLTSYPGVAFRALASEVESVPFGAVWSPSNDNPALRRFLTLLRSSVDATRQS